LPDWIEPNREKEGRLWGGANKVIEAPREKKIKTRED
jgi:hypothetical protein